MNEIVASIDSCINILAEENATNIKTVMNATVAFPSTTHSNKEEK